MASSTRQAFKQAFRAAVDAGDKSFEFEGKTYSTKMAPEKTSSNRGLGGLPSRKSSKDVADYSTSAVRPGKVDRSELEDMDIAPKAAKSTSDRVQYDPTSSSYYANVGNSKSVKIPVPKDKGQTMGFKAEDMGMNSYSKGFKKGGMVRGAGCASKGKGKGMMY